MSVVGRRRPSTLTSTGPRATRCQCSTKLTEPSFHLVLGLPRFVVCPRGIQNECGLSNGFLFFSPHDQHNSIWFLDLVLLVFTPIHWAVLRLACEQALPFGQAKGSSRERANEGPRKTRETRFTRPNKRACHSRLRRSLARFRETRFTCPNRRACSQAILRSRQVMFSTILS